MSGRKKSENGSGMIAAERRRQIFERALQQGSVSVSDLATSLNVAENTIRYDLDILTKEGKLVRSHGGAVIKETGIPMPPYSQVRDANMFQKSRIAAAAAEFLPESGCIFINAGSTTYQLALRIQDFHRFDVTTNSPEIATYLATNSSIEVELLGGKMIKDSKETDGSQAEELLERTYWDTAFLGISALDLDHGITSVTYACALMESRVMENSKKVIALCDSSKLGRYARTQVGPISLIDVLITDAGAKPSIVSALRNEGIQVITAELD